MTTLTVLIDTQSKRKYKLNVQRIEFQELKDRILRSEGLSALRKANKAATKHGLNRMSLKEIENEIIAERRASARS